MGIYNFICGPRSYDAFPKWPARSFGLATPALNKYMKCSFYYFRWLKDLFWKGYNNDLEAEDLYDILANDRSEMLGDELEK
jgi:hypothetical protein